MQAALSLSGCLTVILSLCLTRAILSTTKKEHRESPSPPQRSREHPQLLGGRVGGGFSKGGCRAKPHRVLQGPRPRAPLGSSASGSCEREAPGNALTAAGEQTQPGKGGGSVWSPPCHRVSQRAVEGHQCRAEPAAPGQSPAPRVRQDVGRSLQSGVSWTGQTHVAGRKRTTACSPA